MEKSELKYSLEKQQGLDGKVIVTCEIKGDNVKIKIDAHHTSMMDMLHIKDSINEGFTDLLSKYVKQQEKLKADENK
jgi:hypothetical protein